MKFEDLLLGVAVGLGIAMIIIGVSEAEAHDIDNRSKVLNAVIGGEPGGPSDIPFRVHPDEPLHCDGGVCEGKRTNELLESPVEVNGRTFFQEHKDFGHWRRTLVNKLIVLAGNINGAEWVVRTKGLNIQIPFMTYDPFFLGHDEHHPDIQVQYETNYVPLGYKSISLPSVRANYGEFWAAQHIDVEGVGGSTNPLTYKRCDALMPHELLHAPKCVESSGDTLVMVGGDSYRTPFPNRGEGAFNYYDRIPMSPGDDANLEHCYGRRNTVDAITYIKLHADAGRAHVEDILAKVKYSELVLQKVAGL